MLQHNRSTHVKKKKPLRFATALTLVASISSTIHAITLKIQPTQSATSTATADPSIDKFFKKLQSDDPVFVDELELALLNNKATSTSHSNSGGEGDASPNQNNWWTCDKSVVGMELQMQDPLFETSTVTNDVQKEHIYESETEAAYLLDCKKDHVSRTAGFEPATLMQRLAETDLILKLDLEDEPSFKDVIKQKYKDRIAKLKERGRAKRQRLERERSKANDSRRRGPWQFAQISNSQDNDDEDNDDQGDDVDDEDLGDFVFDVADDSKDVSDTEAVLDKNASERHFGFDVRLLPPPHLLPPPPHHYAGGGPTRVIHVPVPMPPHPYAIGPRHGMPQYHAGLPPPPPPRPQPRLRSPKEESAPRQPSAEELSPTQPDSEPCQDCQIPEQPEEMVNTVVNTEPVIAQDEQQTLKQPIQRPPAPRIEIRRTPSKPDVKPQTSSSAFIPQVSEDWNFVKVLRRNQDDDEDEDTADLDEPLSVPGDEPTGEDENVSEPQQEETATQQDENSDESGIQDSKDSEQITNGTNENNSDQSDDTCGCELPDDHELGGAEDPDSVLPLDIQKQQDEVTSTDGGDSAGNQVEVDDPVDTQKTADKDEQASQSDEVDGTQGQSEEEESSEQVQAMTDPDITPEEPTSAEETTKDQPDNPHHDNECQEEQTSDSSQTDDESQKSQGQAKSDTSDQAQAPSTGPVREDQDSATTTVVDDSENDERSDQPSDTSDDIPTRQPWDYDYSNGAGEDTDDHQQYDDSIYYHEDADNNPVYDSHPVFDSHPVYDSHPYSGYEHDDSIYYSGEEEDNYGDDDSHDDYDYSDYYADPDYYYSDYADKGDQGEDDNHADPDYYYSNYADEDDAEGEDDNHAYPDYYYSDYADEDDAEGEDVTQAKDMEDAEDDDYDYDPYYYKSYSIRPSGPSRHTSAGPQRHTSSAYGGRSNYYDHHQYQDDSEYEPMSGSPQRHSKTYHSLYKDDHSATLARQKQQARQEYLKSLFEKTQNGIYSRDSDGGITSYAEATEATSSDDATIADTTYGSDLEGDTAAAQVVVEEELVMPVVSDDDLDSQSGVLEPAELTSQHPVYSDGFYSDGYDDQLQDSDSLRQMIDEIALSVNLSEGHLLTLKKEVYQNSLQVQVMKNLEKMLEEKLGTMDELLTDSTQQAADLRAEFVDFKREVETASANAPKKGSMVFNLMQMQQMLDGREQVRAAGVDGDGTPTAEWNSESHFPSAGSIVMASFSPEDLIKAASKGESNESKSVEEDV